MHSDNLQELFASLSNALVLYARQWCRTPEDAVQEAFIDLANCSSEPTYPKAWLYTTTRRKAQNIARAESRHRNHLEQLIQERGADRADEYWLEPKTRNQIAASEVLEGLDSGAHVRRTCRADELLTGVGLQTLCLGTYRT